MPTLPHSVALAPIALALFVACTTDPGADSGTIPALAGSWNQIACSIVGGQPPHRSEDCLGASPDRLSAFSDGTWSIDPGTPPGEDPVPSFTGVFAFHGLQLRADYQIGASYDVLVDRDGAEMTWAASAPYTFPAQAAAEPATITVTWLREASSTVGRPHGQP